MAKHCTQCGQLLPDGVKFCTHCGHSVESAQDQTAATRAVAPTLPQVSPEKRHKTQSDKKSITIKKSVLIPVIIAIILIIGFYYTGKVFTDPQRTVDSFRNAVRDHKTHQLAQMIHTNENTKVTDAQAKAMLQLFDKNPSIYSQSLSAMESSAKHSGKQPSGSHALYQLKKSGKKYLIYDNYQITTNNVHPKVVTNLKGMKVGIKNIGKMKIATKANSDDSETITLSGVIPGYYTIIGQSESMNTSQSAAMLSNEDNAIDFSGTFVAISTNLPGAKLFIDDKDASKILSDKAVNVGPYKEGDTPSFYATYTVNGKSIKSNTISISDDESSDDYSEEYEDETTTIDDAESDGINLIFEAAAEEGFYSLNRDDLNGEQNENTLDAYFQDYYDALSSAVNEQDNDYLTDYYETGTSFSQSTFKDLTAIEDKEISESLRSFDVTKISAADSETFTIDVTEDWNEYYYDDDDNAVDKDFTLKTTYQLKPTAPGQLKIVGYKTNGKSEK
ncbi:zinc ribbon domain-containing protein [Sporolactobacillus terrae]|uniref:zinc ribbon domain-containing protein n=1 Tax=Sporolactobacillus terrae TaxID=269673 RepID=UPI00111909E3|nr:zinc-ribbon domain-containing protein [Sporolactobacillus terrae]